MPRQLHTWALPRAELTLGRRTVVMGILNVTPDSFSDGGRWVDTDKAIARGIEMEQQGADLIDVGGESTRPGSEIVSEAEELRRTLPVVEGLCRALQVPVSIDTWRSGVARRATDAGAQIVNDISGFRFDAGMAETVRRSGAAVVLMHSRGERETLHQQPPMTDPVAEVSAELRERVRWAVLQGVAPERIVIDPGIGFGKRADESVELLRGLDRLAGMGYPLLIGTSRKSFIRSIVPDGLDHRLWGTAATVAVAIARGAHIVRVHDVAPLRAIADVADAISRNE